MMHPGCYCPACGDVFALRKNTRLCACQKSAGRNLSKGLAVCFEVEGLGQHAVLNVTIEPPQ